MCQYLPRDFNGGGALRVEHYGATAAALRRRSIKAGTQIQIPAKAKTTPANDGAEQPKTAAITAPPITAPAALAVFESRRQGLGIVGYLHQAHLQGRGETRAEEPAHAEGKDAGNRVR